MAAPDEINVKTIFLVTFISLLIFVELIVGAQVFYYNVKNSQHVQKVVSQPSQQLNSHLADQVETLNSYRWVDQEKQIVAIPIDRAMQLMVEDAKQ